MQKLLYQPVIIHGKMVSMPEQFNREPVTTLADLIGQVPPEEVINHGLLPAFDTGNTLTEKYIVEGNPEVVVRHTPSEPWEPEREVVADVHRNLSDHGISSLPYIPVTLNNEVYIFTRRFHGDHLEDLLTPDIEQTLLDEVDNNWNRLIHYYTTGFRDNETRLTDIDAPHGYMYGRTAVDPVDTKRLVLVDLSTTVMPTSLEYPADESFARGMLGLANSLVGIEKQIRSQGALQLSRQAFAEAQAVATQLPERFTATGVALLRMANDVLVNSQPLDPDEDEELWDIYRDHE